MLINIPLLRKKIRKLFGYGPRYDNTVKELYSTKDYLEAYREHTDLRVEENPETAIGGRWEEIGRLQFNFLVRNGLKPSHSLLDIGCGTLRGGRHFIRHLDKEHYVGFDISPKAIEYARRIVVEESLSDKHPRLNVNKVKSLKFDNYSGQCFDFILAQSVFTHLLSEHIEECLAHVGRVMHDRSVFYFTFNKAKKFKQVNIKDFCYPFSFFQDLAEKYGFRLQDRSKDYPHPKGMKMLSVVKKG